MKIIVNSKEHEIEASPDELLIDILRERLSLTGTKRGCNIGVCGTCTVLIDGKPRRSCIVKMGTLDKKPVPKITTIEGMETEDGLHPIQQAFIDCGAIQCGFCTPGMVLTTKALLDSNPNPSREEIKKALTGNLCRCTGYQQIFEAVEKAAKTISKEAGSQHSSLLLKSVF
ncbi:MAG: (2Fe-2S)-binding protein [Pseudomonadota bacterium]